MAIQWNTVTRTSQLVAIILGVLILAVGFWLGMMYEAKKTVATLPTEPDGKISDVTYGCADSKSIHALFYEDKVTVMLSDGRTLNLPHVISGSGARYANEDESVVFWEKGPSAFVTEGKGSVETYKDCNETPIPE